MIQGKRVLVLRGTILFLLLIGIYFLYTLANYNGFSHDSEILYLANNNVDTPIGEIIDGVTVEQIIPVDKVISSIDIMFATYARVNEGQVTVSIQGNTSGEIYTQEEIDASDINDNAYLSFDLQPTVDPQKDHNITISITSNSLPGSAITIWSSTDDEIPEGDLLVDGSKLSGDLVLIANTIEKMTYWQPVRILHLYYILFFSLIITYTLLNPLPHCYEKIIRVSGRQMRAPKAYRKWGMMLAFLLIIACLIWRSLDGDYTGLQSSRWEFYLLVFLLLLFIKTTVKSQEKVLYIMVIALAIVWIIFDTGLNVIDEGAHLGIINYIIDHSRFPTVQENYEAVQGPVYYYLLAIVLKCFPESIRVPLGRMIGLLCVLCVGFLTRKMINRLCEYQIICVSEEAKNIFWLLFVCNPCLLTRATRISNESIVLVLSALFLYLMTMQILGSYNKKIALLCTTICAISFLTKSTTVFLFGGCMALFIYYKKWREMVKNIVVFILLVSPWFVYNYISFGALTAMKGHMNFVLPIVNPDMIPVDIWETLIHYFDNYFFNIEVGYWYDYLRLDNFVSTLMLFVMCVAVYKMIKLAYFFIKKRLNFKYDILEKKKIIFIIYVLLPVAALIMHAISSRITFINSLAQNRYLFVINGAICSIFLMSLSKLPECLQRYTANFSILVFSFLNVSMIYGYLQTILF